MSKHFFRKTLVMLLLVTVLVSSMAMPVSAADSKMTIKYIFYGTDYLTFPVTYYDGTSATARMAGMNIHYIDGKVAYCLEPQASSTANTIYSSFSNNDSTFWGKKISPAKQNAIMLAMAYGAPNKLSSSNAYTNYGYMAATQIVIWEILMDYRSATPPYACTNSRLYNHMIKSSGGNSDDVAGMKNGYAAINASLAAHGKIPSFAKVAQSQAETKEMQYDAASGKYTLTLTDSNNAINSDFTFSGSGVTCTKSGNKLTITAPASAVQGKTVLITGVGSNPDVSSIAPVVWGTQNSNGSRDQILCQYGSPDPVKVYFKVTASSTSLDIVKQADDGNVANITFTVKDNAGNTLFTGKTNSQGKLNVPGLTIGQTVTVTETVPANYVADQRTQTITLKAGTNTLTFVNHPMGTLAMKKTSDTGDVEGYCFKIYKWTDNISWYGKTDGSGNVYVTNSSYSASGTKTYTFTGLNDGTYTFLEVLSEKGKDLVFPDSWTITVKRGGSTVFNKTYTSADLTRDDNGDCRLNKIAITGLSGGGVMTMTIHNAPETGDLEIVKTSTDGKVKDISFKVEQYEPEGGIGWWTKGTYKTDANGKISIEGLQVGTKLRITEIVPDGYECTTENPQTITLKRGTNTVTFTNKPTTTNCEIIKQSDDGNIKGITFTVKDSKGKVVFTGQTDKDGKISVPDLTIGETYTVIETVPENYVADKREQTIKVTEGTNSLTFVNHPVSKLELIKTSDDGNVKNISFKVEEYEPEGGIGWWTKGTYKTDSNGKIDLELKYGYKYRVTEAVPEDYVSDNRVQEFTAKLGTNTLSFVNHPVAKLEIVKTSTDGKVAGITFKVEAQNSNKWTELGTYVSDQNGKILVEGLEVGMKVRITEVVPENYICTTTNPQTVTLVKGTNRVSFSNKPVVTLELIKTSEDGQVEGIEFTLEQKNENDYTVIGTYVTDADGKITVEDLTEGATYRLSETVPEGYIGETPVQEFTAQLGTNSVSFTNRLIRGNLRIVKVDKATQTPLEGAGFRVFNAAGEVVAEGYTDENGEVAFEQLAYGEYTYQEFEAPVGFVLDDEVYNFLILEDGVEVVKQHDNQPKEGSITIYKVDEAGRALPGVTFLLEYSVDGGKTWAPIHYRDAKDDVLAGYCTSDGLNQGKLVTGDDGYAVFTGLCIDTQLGEVRYRVTETATKNGYNLLPDYAFDGSLPEDEEIEVSFTVVNQPEFKMPATGGGGFIGTAIAVALAGIAAGAMLFVMIKRRKAE
ncbi:MAG: Cys-Gln thioester bond-forming surface protein [Bacteroidales bacterium]|nr:Cys-Gln thioester bond-forming surface protein [Bacteroidales bacterium]